MRYARAESRQLERQGEREPQPAVSVALGNSLVPLSSWKTPASGFGEKAWELVAYRAYGVSGMPLPLWAVA